MRKIILLIIIFFLNSFVLGQNQCDIYSYNPLKKNYSLEAIKINPKNYLDSLTQLGYYALKIDSSFIEKEKCKIFIHKGAFYNHYIVQSDSLKNLLPLQGLDKIKDEYKQQGKLFSKFTLKPYGFNKNQPVYYLDIEKESKRYINDIEFVGYDKIPNGFKEQLIKNKVVASKKSIQIVENIISKSNHIDLYQPSKISFTLDSSLLYIYAKKRRNNSFDGLIGFSSNQSNKIQLNGNINLKLNNAFNQFEKINLTWLGGKNKSQHLNFGVHFPYVIFNHVGLLSNLEIKKQDSTFLQLRIKNGLTYQINSSQHFTTYYNYENSNYIKENIVTGKDYSKNGFGVSYHYINSKNLIFKENKFNLNIYTSLLNKKTASASQKQTELIYNTAIQHHLLNNHYVFAKIQGESLIQKEKIILLNEMYQIGGLNDLRGFNQNSIFTESYQLGTLSYRYIPSNDFIWETFSDVARVRNIENQKTTYYISLGTGIQLRTNIGILKFVYATGKSQNSTFDFARGKVHFGIETNF